MTFYISALEIFLLTYLLRHKSLIVHIHHLEDNEEKVLLSLLHLFQLLLFTFDAVFSRHRVVIVGREVVSSLTRIKLHSEISKQRHVALSKNTEI